MSKNSKILKRILNSEDIIYPHQLYRGLNLSEDDFISLRDIFKTCHLKALEKYRHIRNIGNKIIAKDGLLQGISYCETSGPELKLLFKKDKPLDYDRKLKETKDHNKRNELQEEINTYRIKNKDILAQIDSFKIEEHDFGFPSYTINQFVINYLLNAVDLASDLDLIITREYLDELTMFNDCLKNGIFYPDFNTVDYTGILKISSEHTYTSLSQDNTVVMPTNFGTITVYLDKSGWSSFKIVYKCADDTCKLYTDINIKDRKRIPDRGFVHKALLPEQYQHRNK